MLVLITLALPVAGVSAALKSGATLKSEWSAEGETIVVQESDRKINFKGRWSTVDDQDYMGGKAKETGAGNAKSGFKFTGAAVAWIGSVGPTHGTAKVYIDGQLAAGVDTWASTFDPAVVLFQKSWDAVGSHNITIVASGTAGHPAIAVDAFLVLVRLSGTPDADADAEPDTDPQADADSDAEPDADADADAEPRADSDAGAHSHAESLADSDAVPLRRPPARA